MRLMDHINLSRACDVFVLNEGGHRYRDALASTVLCQYLGLERDVHVWPVLTRVPEEPQDSEHNALAAETAARLIRPSAQSMTRSALVLGRAQLFDPEISLQDVAEGSEPDNANPFAVHLHPELPIEMDDTPSADREYRMLRFIHGQAGRAGREKRAYAITSKTDQGPVPINDYAVIYCGWQMVGQAQRRLVILEGVSALGTIGAVKAFCASGGLLPQLVGVESFCLIYTVKLDLRTSERAHHAHIIINRDGMEEAARRLPWLWTDVKVTKKPKYCFALAPLHKRPDGQFAFLGKPLIQYNNREQESLRLAVLDHLVLRAGTWIEETEITRLFTTEQFRRPGLHTVLKQVIEGLIAQGMVIEQGKNPNRFRHLASSKAETGA